MHASSNHGVTVVPENIVTKFRDSFESFTDGIFWNLSKADGDIVQVDGNAASASYLVISKDPLTAGGVTTLTSVGTFEMPVELSVGLSMSQRVLGQELSMEFVSTEDALPLVDDVSIASISQTASTLTVDTAAPHNLVPGKRVGIYGCTDSRLNYPSLVVATILSPTRFTSTAGAGGTIPSLSLSGAGSGFVYFRSALGYAQNGFSQVFESTSVTSASIYSRSSSGDALPSGVIAGSHAVTVSTTASVQAVNSPYTYAFLPSSEYRMAIQADRVQAYDGLVDSASPQVNRILRTQVVPDSTKRYKLRLRMTNNKGVTVPVARIASISKTGTTTATVVTDLPHGLTVSDWVGVFGVRDQTNFPNITTAAAITGVLSDVSFTVVIGAAVTATSQGGLVARVNGSSTATAVQNVALQSASSNGAELTLIGSASWAVLVGDYVNAYGLFATGLDLGVDGVYRVVNVATSTLTLAPIDPSVLIPVFTSTLCGGAVIKRTDARVSFARVFDYVRQRVEILPRPDNAGALAAYMTGGVLSTVSSVSTVSTASLAANVLVVDSASAALTSTATSSAITPGSGALSNQFNVIVSAVAGTSPVLDVVVQESDDGGTSWFDVYHFPRITAAGQYRSPLIPQVGTRIRYVRTVAGTSPSFTHAVNRLQSHSYSPVQRQFFDRALVLNTLNSVTPSFFVEGCSDINLVVSMAAVTTTPPVLALEFSADGSQWYQPGADIATAANINLLACADSLLSRFCRVRVKTAGVGAAMNYLFVKGIGR